MKSGMTGIRAVVNVAIWFAGPVWDVRNPTADGIDRMT